MRLRSERTFWRFGLLAWKCRAAITGSSAKDATARVGSRACQTDGGNLDTEYDGAYGIWGNRWEQEELQPEEQRKKATDPS